MLLRIKSERAMRAKSAWSFLKVDRNRAVLGWLGTGIAVVFGALWAVYLHVAAVPTAGSVSARDGGVAAGGDINRSTININSTGK